MRLTSLVVLMSLAGCAPSNVEEAERRGDVGWLDESGTVDAVAALGRVADRNPKAQAALELRSAYDVQAYRAAWAAVVRGAPWGAMMLRAGLADPKRADEAASGMTKHDPRLAIFVEDLEQTLVRLSATPQNFNVSTTLASVGPAAHDAVVRRLTDPSTRGAMCRGIASKDADVDARKTLLVGAESSRNAPSCVDAVVSIAAADDAALAWVGEAGEPGLLGAAGREETLPCARLHVAWTKAFATRPPEVYAALTVPLGYAVKRCPAEMDGILADAITHYPAAHGFLVEAIDPFDGYGSALHATCASLPIVTGGKDTAVVRERATDVLNHSCKTPG